MKKLLLLAAGAMLATSAMAESWAIIGESTSWGVNEDYVFVADGDTYTLEVANLLNSFKVVPVNDDNSPNWDYCYSTSTPIELGKTYTLEARDGGPDLPNMGFGGDIMSVNKATITWNPSTAAFMVTGEPVIQANDGSVIYLIGTPSGWNINSDAMPLEAVSDGVYEGVYEIDANPSFRFYTKLGNWEANSIGSQVADNALPFELEDGVYEGPCVEGKGSWNLTNWEGGEMKLVVNLNDMTVTFSGNNSGEVEPGPGPEVEDLYLIGSDVDGESWVLGTNMMTYENGLYTWTGTTLASGFKFNNGSWSDPNYNIGAQDNSVHLVIGEPYTVVANGDSQDILFDGDAVENPVVVLNLENMTVTVTSGAGVESIVDENAPAVYYNLQGVKVNNPVKGGVYVVKKGNKTSKVVVR